jgi:putative SOS response-associated peptidase YedK
MISVSKAALAPSSSSHATMSRRPIRFRFLSLGEHGQRELSQMVWGIATPARDNKKRLTRHINARVENLTSNALWRVALRETRCVVVSDGFYEWSGASRTSDRRPFFLHRHDDALILTAGL